MVLVMSSHQLMKLSPQLPHTGNHRTWSVLVNNLTCSVSGCSSQTSGSTDPAAFVCFFRSTQSTNKLMDKQSCFLHNSMNVHKCSTIATALHFITLNYLSKCGPGSVAGIRTGYGLDGPGIEPRWGQDLPHLSRPALGATQPPI